jgi:hypothetical protein
LLDLEEVAIVAFPVSIEKKPFAANNRVAIQASLAACLRIRCLATKEFVSISQIAVTAVQQGP